MTGSTNDFFVAIMDDGRVIGPERGRGQTPRDIARKFAVMLSKGNVRYHGGAAHKYEWSIDHVGDDGRFAVMANWKPSSGQIAWFGPADMYRAPHNQAERAERGFAGLPIYDGEVTP